MADTEASTGEPRIRVGLLNDTTCTDERSREAAWRVLTSAADIEATRVLAADLRSGALENLDVVILPGGTGGGQGKALQVEGGDKVTKFAEGGGGVIAICAGGYLVVKGWNPETRAIELVNAETFDDAHWARGEGFITVQVAEPGTTTSQADERTSRTMWFENGPIFVPAAESLHPAYTPLVRYVTDMAATGAPKGMMAGRDAVIAAPVGKGRIVVFGPHPELSPGQNHWLPNAVRWAARRAPEGPITPALVLEGKP